MKQKNITLGILLLAAGIIWLLFNFDILDWRIFESLKLLWPLALVVIGVNLLFRNNSIVRIITWLVFIVVVICYSLFVSEPFSWRFPNGRTYIVDNYVIQYGKSEKVQSAVIDADLGSYSFDVEASDDEFLFRADMGGREVDSDMDYKDNGTRAEIRLRDKRWLPGGSNNTCKLYLNKEVEWELDLDMGAHGGRFDFREIKLRKFDLDSGAGNLDLYLGSNVPITEVEIDTGASSINVHLPVDAGVRIKFDGGVSRSNLSSLGWEKIGGYYTSPNYEFADCKIVIDVDMGVGKFNVLYD